MALCIGKTKADKPCKSKPQPGRRFCKVHDKDYKDAKKTSTLERKAKTTKTLQYIAAKIGSKRLAEGNAEDEFVKNARPHNTSAVVGYVEKTIIPCIEKLAVMEHDDYGYPRRQTPLVRKFWMMLSWAVSDDSKTYMNVAMTCKGLYKVFVLDKVKYYVHPLKGEIRSPLLFFRPIYRVLSLEVPEDLDEVLEISKLPKVEDFLAVYEDEYGPAKTKSLMIRRRAEAINELLKHLVTVNMEPEQEPEEVIKGAGLFGEYTSEAKFILENFPYRYKLFKRGQTTYIMIDAELSPGFERKLKDSLCPYDGKYLIKLMHVH